MSDEPCGIADLRPLARMQEQKAWYWYDWANSAYVTTIATVLFAPYLIAIAEKAACGYVGDDDRSCNQDLSILGLAVAPGALPAYIVTFSTLLSAVLLPLLGAIADRTENKKGLLAGFAWTGAAFASLLFFCTGDNWQIGAVAVIGANLCLGASTVFNDAILPLISEEHERDRVSSRGWAWGYLGGGILLSANLVVVQLHDVFGIDKGMAVRLSMLSAAIWWAAFTFIPFRGLRNHPPEHVEAGRGRPDPGQLRAALGDVEGHEELPHGAHLPGGVPLLQRRHPDGDRDLLDVRREAARVRDLDPDRDDPAGAVRGLLRRPRSSAGRRSATVRSR